MREETRCPMPCGRGAIAGSSRSRGVETPAQANALRGMACTIAQGYHFARPLGADEVARLLAAPAGLAA
jgi:predicted signal transduction protein with EAL and GGDEF domain